jgi:hypothetical protein
VARSLHPPGSGTVPGGVRGNVDVAERARGSGSRRRGGRGPSDREQRERSAGAARARRGAAPALIGAAMGGVLALTTILMTERDAVAGPVATPAAAVGPGPVAPGDPPARAAPPDAAKPGRLPVPAADDPGVTGTPEALAFLAALRDAAVPTSRTGLAEVLIARAACAELNGGTSDDDLARRIPRGLPTLNRAQAARLVEIARKHYC